MRYGSPIFVLYARSVLIGACLAAIFVAVRAILSGGDDGAGGTGIGPAAVLLWAVLVPAFAGVQMGLSIMTMDAAGLMRLRQSSRLTRRRARWW